MDKLGSNGSGCRRILNSDRTLKPLPAALFMGAVVALSLLWTGKGIHVSGLFSLLCPPTMAPQAVTGDELFCSSQIPAANIKWIAWMVAGIFVGAFASSFWRTRGFTFQIERGKGVSPAIRLILAAAGGLTVGAGAALAGGCTSSIGLTGSAVLSIGAFSFLAAFFAGGFAARVFWGRFWHV